jgi:hypothetical protein
MISKFYYDDFSTPVTSKQHTEVLSDQERLDSRPWIYSFSPGGGTASWADWGKLQYFSQDEPSSRITTARRIAIRSELGAAYGF